ncbi:MAG: MoaD/ThiS family protein [Candidatus Rokubacteria bacterium]|nr:MoaD/ThiS family protein [Candidatus Rokubacteria bacterium]
MRVFIASPLYSYTGGRGEVEGTGATVAEMLADLDRRFPGIRRRIVDEQDQVRQHMRIYIGTEPAATLDQPIPEDQEIHILQALSGGRRRSPEAASSASLAASR